MTIYKATNKLNGKVYIGQTIQILSERIGDHKRKAFIYKSKGYFQSAIRKYGINGFVFEIIDTAKTRDELNKKEIHWIKYYKSTDKEHGYNQTHGGNQPVFTEEIKKKIGDTQRGKKRSSEFRMKISNATKGEKNPFYGKHHSEESKIKNSNAHKGKSSWNKGLKNCQVAWNKGKSWNNESKLKMSLAHKKRWEKYRNECLEKLSTGTLF